MQVNIDAGAEALRQRMQGGKLLTEWDRLPNATKKKWREYARIVCEAAIAEIIDDDRPAREDESDVCPHGKGFDENCWQCEEEQDEQEGIL